MNQDERQRFIQALQKIEIAADLLEGAGPAQSKLFAATLTLAGLDLADLPASVGADYISLDQVLGLTKGSGMNFNLNAAETERAIALIFSLRASLRSLVMGGP
jgi:hypothetical protein